MTRYQDRKVATALKSALEELPDDYLACRDLKHAWNKKPLRDFYVDPNPGKFRGDIIVRELECARCGMIRVDRFIVGEFGLTKVRMNYRQPEGYAITGVPRGVKPSGVVQGVQYRRAMERAAKVTNIRSKRKTG